MAGRLWDGPVLRRWLVRAVDGLELAGPRIDAVNVFPVADQDTGTNCLLTLRGAAEEVTGLPPEADGVTVLAAAARGALLAARGNSGMILSHWIAGLARGAEGGVVRALEAAAASARSAVSEPEPGTVLDLAAELAGAAASAELDGLDERDTLAAALTAGRGALAGISARHPVLRDARVWDAGACALLVVLDAWLDWGPIDLSWLPEATPAAFTDHGLSGFEVMAVLPAGDDDLLRAELARVGDAVAVVTEPGSGADRLCQSHVHTVDPAAAVRALRAVAGRAPVVAVVQALGAEPVPAPAADGHFGPATAVAVTGDPDRAESLARTGAVVLVASTDPAPDAASWARALHRSVRDARTGQDPVPVLPGVWAAPCAPVLPSGAMLIAEADDDDRVLAVLRALAGEVTA